MLPIHPERLQCLKDEERAAQQLKQLSSTGFISVPGEQETSVAKPQEKPSADELELQARLQNLTAK